MTEAAGRPDASGTGPTGGPIDRAAASSADDRLLAWAEAVSDGRSVDWEQVRAAAPDLAESILALRLVESVIGAHRTPGGAGAADPAAAARALPADSSWGGLQLLEKIGEGVYGDVYRAFEPSLGIEVALKILRGRRDVDDPAAARFFEEAHRLARVRNPNVLRVYGAAAHENHVGIWTELIRGETLEELLEARGRLGVKESVRIGVEICRALAAVHEAGLVHRDLKAANVMRGQDGRIVLMDFGSMEELPSVSGAVRDPGQGTPMAVAPEILNGGPVTHATDIYGLGVLLYRLVSGRYPVEAHSLAELIVKHDRGERTSLREIRPDLPGAFVRVVERALDSDPERRFGDPRAMERALAGLLTSTADEPETGAVTALRAKRRRQFAMGVLVAVVAGLVVMEAVERLTEPLRLPFGAAKPGASGLLASATVYRQRDSQREALGDDANAWPGDTLYVELECDEPLYAYLIVMDTTGRIERISASPATPGQGPLSGGVRHHLPGVSGDPAPYWCVSGPPGPREVHVVGSRTPIAEFESVPGRVPSGGSRPTAQAEARLSALLGPVPGGNHRHGDVWTWHAHLVYAAHP